jgi:hypothetical protein
MLLRSVNLGRVVKAYPPSGLARRRVDLRIAVGAMPPQDRQNVRLITPV